MHDLLTLNEAASQLRKSPAALRWQIHNATAPRSALLGGRRLFLQSDVDAYIAKAFADSDGGTV